MKKLYWRPQRISTGVVVLLSLLAVAGLLSVETFKVTERQRFYREKLAAARLSLQAFEVIKAERRKRGISINSGLDPARSGMIGPLISPATTNSGHLTSKQTSVNPNFAAVVVHLLLRAGVERGDHVAVGLSGSFPALNIATLAAVQAIGARYIAISSAGSSQFGANHPDLMWPDMEEVLVQRRVLRRRSVAVSLGGVDDRGTGLSDEGLAKLKAAIERNRAPFLDSTGYEDGLARRMKLYRKHAAGSPIQAYINVGGGTISVGTRTGKYSFKPGLNRYIPKGAAAIDSVMTRFARAGVPIIHLSRINELAQRHGLPVEPKEIPTVGEGKIFEREDYSSWFAAGVLLAVLALMFGFLRLDLAYRLFPARVRDGDSSRPEPMV